MLIRVFGGIVKIEKYSGKTVCIGAQIFNWRYSLIPQLANTLKSVVSFLYRIAHLMAENNRLLRTSFALGFIPLVVGLMIFFSWWAGKAWFLTNIHSLETAGLLWIPIAAFMALMGIFTTMLYLWKSRKNRAAVLKALAALFLIFANIPALFWVLDRQEQIDHRAYVRVYNKTGSDISAITISNAIYTAQLDGINHGDYETVYFYPDYNEFESGESPKPVIMTMSWNGDNVTITLPDIYMGECVRLAINQTMKAEIID